MGQIYWASKTTAQTLVGPNLKTTENNTPEFDSLFPQNVLNLNFQNYWTTSVEMTVAWKSNITDTSNIECVCHALGMAYCCDKEVPGLSMVPIVFLVTVNTI